MVALTKARATTRGRGSRVIEFDVVGKVTPFDKDAEGNAIPADKQDSKSDTIDHRGVITTVPELVELASGDLQKALDWAAFGYNEESRAAAVETDIFGDTLDAIDWKAVAAKSKIEDRPAGVDEKGNKVREINAVETVKGQFKRMVKTMLQQNGDEETPENVSEAVTYLSRKMPKVEKAA